MAEEQAQAKPRTAKKKHGKLSTVLPVLGMLLGAAIIAFYPLSELYSAWQRMQVANDVETVVSEASDDELDEIFAQAHAYNRLLAGLSSDIDREDVWPYEEQLALAGEDASFGYVIVPTLGLTMPIYHGTSDAVLSAGAGHLESTSLPVGGKSTHAVITAHSGMSGMRAFDDVDQLEEGDVFGVKVLGRLCCYEVTSTEVVWPDEVDSLEIEAGEDLCTLVTCTPYGVNDHRLLVHGKRCAVPDWFDDSASTPLESLIESDRWLILLAAIAVVALLVAFLARRARKSNRRKREAAAGKASGQAR